LVVVGMSAGLGAVVWAPVTGILTSKKAVA
jgi:H+/Cl- antiporter ClcA